MYFIDGSSIMILHCCCHLLICWEMKNNLIKYYEIYRFVVAFYFALVKYFINDIRISINNYVLIQNLYFHKYFWNSILIILCFTVFQVIWILQSSNVSEWTLMSRVHHRFTDVLKDCFSFPVGIYSFQCVCK